ncbi:MAG TPA: low affinity iron permease family protein [Clostridia bacterium]|nr:low affinity iron permease family protein [Clostridia bacterium]
MSLGSGEKAPSPANGSNSRSFSRFAARTATLVGSSWIFILACASIFIWAFTGPIFHFSDTWQLIINTATTIVTFLMVFLIQNTQNRDARALHLKLDEIIRSIRHAHNDMIDIEKLSDEELENMTKHYERIREEYEHRAASRVHSKKKLPAA